MFYVNIKISNLLIKSKYLAISIEDGNIVVFGRTPLVKLESIDINNIKSVIWSQNPFNGNVQVVISQSGRIIAYVIDKNLISDVASFKSQLANKPYDKNVTINESIYVRVPPTIY
jgi:hypothetical protein